MASVRNYWMDAKCAKAFWAQHDLPPYRRLLADTMAWVDQQPGEHWLDLGCGGGALSRAIWERSQGQVGSVVGVDCAYANADAYRRLRASLEPLPTEDRFRFLCHNFSAGLAPIGDQTFDHAVSGLSISYAESFDDRTGTWNAAAYDRVLAEVYRVLKPGGRFVFSVNVPEPSWLRVGVRSVAGAFQASRPLHFFKKSLRMMRYGRWLKLEARKGRFHFLPHQQISAKLQALGYQEISHRLSYVDQAYLFKAVKRS